MPRPTPAAPALTATDLLHGAQCDKRQYLELHARDLAEPMDEATRLLAEDGLEVEQIARTMFPTGVLILGRDHAEGTIARTRTVMRRKRKVPLFRPAFRQRGVTVRPNLMVPRVDGSWDVAEISSSTEVKEVDILKLAIAADALRRSRVDVQRFTVIHPNPAYRLPHDGTLVPEDFFVFEDVTEAVYGALAAVEPLRKQAQAAVAATFPPMVEMGSHCNSPTPCPFKAHCKQLLVPDPIEELHDLRPKLRDFLRTSGIRSIRQIPTEWLLVGAVVDMPLEDLRAMIAAAQAQGEAPTAIHLPKDRVIARLSWPKLLQIQAVQTGQPAIRREALEAALATIPARRSYLDFEWYAKAVPSEPGMKPHEAIPFLFSIQHQLENGQVFPTNYIHAEGGDPRVRLTEHLVNSLPDEGGYLIWSKAEKTVLRNLTRHFYQMALSLGQLLRHQGTAPTAAALAQAATANDELDQAMVAKVRRLYGLLRIRQQTLEVGADRLDEIAHELDPHLADLVREHASTLLNAVHEEQVDRVLESWDPVLGTTHFFRDLREGMAPDRAFELMLVHWHGEWVRFIHQLQLAGGRSLSLEEWPDHLPTLRALLGGVFQARRHPEAWQRLLATTKDAFASTQRWERAQAAYGEEGRLIDQLPMSRDCVAVPDQQGSHSIKTVVKQIPGFGYDDLEIKDGATAQMKFVQLVRGEVPPHEIPGLCIALTNYCDRDTESQVRVLMHWTQLVREQEQRLVHRRRVRVAPSGRVPIG